MPSLRFHSILYLDMTRTAMVACLLGPWREAVTALLSSSLVNWLAYPSEGAESAVFPWVLVNMTGGFLWGMLARQTRFRKYLRSAHTSSMIHIWFLSMLGMFGAAVMSLPGSALQMTLGQHQALALEQDPGANLDALGNWVETFPSSRLRRSLGGDHRQHNPFGLEHFFQYLTTRPSASQLRCMW